MATKEISAADALALFAKQGIKVQTARAVKVKGDDGKQREAFKAEDADLAEEHILSAKKYDDGRVTITTIDGQKYEARATRGKVAA
jgi:hypothetical protein